MVKRKKNKYGYAFVFYDIGERRVQKVFKVCKKYLNHYQLSVFRGPITPASLISLKHELRSIIDPEEDFVSIVKLKADYIFDEDILGRYSEGEKKDSDFI